MACQNWTLTKSEGSRRHFLFLPKEKFFEDNYKNDEALDVQKSMFEELGLNIIRYNNENGKHEQLPIFLERIKNRYYINKVLGD